MVVETGDYKRVNIRFLINECQSSMYGRMANAKITIILNVAGNVEAASNVYCIKYH